MLLFFRFFLVTMQSLCRVKMKMSPEINVFYVILSKVNPFISVQQKFILSLGLG